MLCSIADYYPTEIQLVDWSTAGNLSNRSSGVQIPRDICTRFGRYLYTTKCSWIILSAIRMEWLPVVNEMVTLIPENAKRKMVGQHAQISRQKFVAFAHFIMYPMKTNCDRGNRLTATKLCYIFSRCVSPDVYYFQEVYFAQSCSRFVPRILFCIHVKKFALLFTPPATSFLPHMDNNGPPAYPPLLGLLLSSCIHHLPPSNTSTQSSTSFTLNRPDFTSSHHTPSTLRITSTPLTSSSFLLVFWL